VTNGVDLIVCAEDDGVAVAAREMEDHGASTDAVGVGHRRRAEPGSAPDDED
jgi:hypothetical protein